MIEAGWVVLLLFAYCDGRNRYLADVLVAKWALNYFAFLFISEQAPVFVDIVLGTVGIYLAARRKPLFAWLFAASVLVRATYWTLWDVGIWLPNVHYWTLIGLFTWQILLIDPWRRARDVMGSFARRVMALRPVSGFKGQTARARTSAV